MLIEKPIDAGDVVCLKLSNGDELIAKIKLLTDAFVTVSKPMLMMIAQDPRTGQPGVQMVPFWMVGSNPDSNFPINRAHVVCMIKANSEALNGYTVNTTGLAIPGAGNSGLIT